MQAGADHGLINAGYRAIESCRLEKGYRAWGSDIGPDHSPDEAGLGWAVRLKKNEDFIGREAVLKQRESGAKKIMATFTVDSPDIILFGRETIYRNGLQVGWLSSGGYGYTIGKYIGYGYVRHDQPIDNDFVLEGNYELEVATERVPCKVHLQPLYDATMSRVKM